MAVYVDPLQFHTRGPLKRVGRPVQWCHLMTDGELEELHQFARKIGLKRSWFQDDKRHPHYDLTSSRRVFAVALGAVQVSSQEMLDRCRRTE